MQSMEWPPEHSDALRNFLGNGMSYSEIARAINEKFNTTYTRSAAIGRARRLGLVSPARLRKAPPLVPEAGGGRGAGSIPRLRKRRRVKNVPPGSVSRPPEHPVTAPLRCVDVNPRHLALHEVELRDCRYPYGGDAEGEAITFCGHPRRPGSSYCEPHFHLTRGPGIQLDRAAARVLLRLVEPT